jgi:hypothetical protein
MATTTTRKETKMTTATKIKVGTVKRIQCSRCQGKGIGGWSACHMGIPGLCCKCDGVGTVERLTADQKKARKVNRTINHLNEREEMGRNAVIAADQNSCPEAKRTDDNGWWPMDAERVADCRVQWTRVNNQLLELLNN